MSLAEWNLLAKHTPFEPNKRQLEFRNIAYECVESGEVFNKEWYAASRKQGVFKKKPMRHAEWLAWMEDAKFMAWFYCDLPHASPPDNYQKNILESYFWDGLKTGLLDGKEWAHTLFAKMQFKSDKQQQLGREVELRAFVGSPTESAGWKGEPAEA